MRHRWFKRLFHSVFTKLLVIIVAAGVAITLSVIVGFAIIHYQNIGDLDRNLALYADYIAQDIGDPPDLNRAERIARRPATRMRLSGPAVSEEILLSAFPTPAAS